VSALGGRLQVLWAGAIAVAVAVALLASSAGSGAFTIKPSHRPRFSHAAVLVLENRGYRVLHSRQAPYLRSLVSRYGLATDYFGVSHPSLPNYLALTGGNTFRISNDCSSCQTNGKSLFDQLSAAGISWRAYFEGGLLPTHRIDPFLHYDRATDGPLLTHSTGIAALRSDIANRSLPRFSWIGLGLCHDGHSCRISVADRYLHSLIPGLLHALGRHGVLFITWDEGTTDASTHGASGGGGHVPLIVAGGAARPHGRADGALNHYGLLHEIESSFGLPALRRAAGTPIGPVARLLEPRRTA